jgi:hypothetical protein
LVEENVMAFPQSALALIEKLCMSPEPT